VINPFFLNFSTLAQTVSARLLDYSVPGDLLPVLPLVALALAGPVVEAAQAGVRGEVLTLTVHQR